MTQAVDEEAEVVEFGDKEPRSRRAILTQALAGVRRDPRLVPVIAGLGAVALFASLAGEWQTTTVDEGYIQPEAAGQALPAGLAELGGWAAAYSVGIFALVGCAGLVLFGRPAARDHARVLGLTTAGVLVGILAAITMWLGDGSVILGPSFYNPELQYELAYGRGLTTAFVGVVLLGVALFLAGRLMPAAPDAPPAPPAATEDVKEEEPAEQGDWPWRRPRQAREAHDPEADLPPPIDLTVAPTAPFVPLPDGKTDG